MTWRVAKSLLKLRSQLDSAFPSRNRDIDGTIRTVVSVSKRSDHTPWVKDGQMGVVTAMDITHDPKSGVDAQQLAEHFRQTKDIRIKYIVFNKRIFSYEIAPWQWRKYLGPHLHDNHIHISVRQLKSLYDDEKPWNLGDLEPNTTALSVPEHPVLAYESRGEFVGELQKMLGVVPEFVLDERTFIARFLDWLLGIPAPTKEPWFGPRTEKYVKDYQAMRKLVVDGIVGPYTWRALEGK